MNYRVVIKITNSTKNKDNGQNILIYFQISDFRVNVVNTLLKQVMSVCSFFTLNRTKAPFFSVIIAGAGSTPEQMVVTAFGCALIVPFVVVLKGQSTGHAMCISQQGVDICESHKSSVMVSVCYFPKKLQILEHMQRTLPSYVCEQGPSLSVLYFFHK